MKQILIVLLMFLAGFTPQVSAGDPPKNPREIKIGPSDPKSKPHSPGFENEVTGLLDGQVLTITFAEPEGMARVSLREGGVQTVYTGFHATAAPIVVTVPTTDVPVQIYIKTQSNEYEGWIE